MDRWIDRPTDCRRDGGTKARRDGARDRKQMMKEECGRRTEGQRDGGMQGWSTTMTVPAGAVATITMTMKDLATYINVGDNDNEKKDNHNGDNEPHDKDAHINRDNITTAAAAADGDSVGSMTVTW